MRPAGSRAIRDASGRPEYGAPAPTKGMWGPMQKEDGGDGETPLVTNRPMDIAVALALLAGSALVIWDSVRIGYGWIEGQGPGAGYFPFYVAVLLALASLVTLFRALFLPTKSDTEPFVSIPAFGRVLAVLLPSCAYVAMIHWVGIYVVSAIFIAGFVLVFEPRAIIKAMLVGIGIPVVLFMLFEKWFLVPLPKGPLEAMIGL